MTRFTDAPGFKTSEYRVTIVGSFISGLIGLVALFSPGFNIDSDTQGAVAVVASAAIGLIGAIYTRGRSQVKSAAAQAVQAVPAIANVETVNQITTTTEASNPIVE